VLLERLRRDPNPRGSILVSSDRELRDAARRLGARLWTAEELLNRMEPAGREEPEKPREPSDREVESWLEIFEERT